MGKCVGHHRLKHFLNSIEAQWLGSWQIRHLHYNEELFVNHDFIELDLHNFEAILCLIELGNANLTVKWVYRLFASQGLWNIALQLIEIGLFIRLQGISLVDKAADHL